MKLKPDQIIDNRYKIIERLGKGGMGEVWKATDQQLDDEVVLKMPLVNSDPAILQRFATEARLMRRHSTGNPNIVDIQGVGDIDGTPYYVMRYLSGGSLEDRSPLVDANAPEFITETFEWLLSIGKALDYLHGSGVLHRDVKPANIIFNRSGDGYLADFGIAKNPTEVTAFTQISTATGVSPGTFGYMAPEVLRPDPDIPATGAVDQYALAVTLYESIAGKRPYAATNLIELYIQTQEGCPPLCDSIPDLPESASGALMKALSASPDDRFSSCRQFAETFLAGLSGKIASSVVPPAMDPAEAETGMVPVVGSGVVSGEVQGGTPVIGPGASHDGGRLFGANRGPVIPKKPDGPATGRSMAPALIGLGALLLALIGGGLFFSGAFSGGTNQPLAVRPDSPDQPPGVSPGSSLAGSSDSGSTDRNLDTDFVSEGSGAKEDFTQGSDSKDEPSSVRPVSSRLRFPFGSSEIKDALSSLQRTKGLESDLTNSIGMKFRLIPAGTFMMGSPTDEPDRYDNETQHRVEISRDFYLGKYEVTQGEWKSVMGTEPWKGKRVVKEGDDYAASYVSWEDAVAFCQKLSSRDGVEYRLPSEAEWEYACRGGSESAYSCLLYTSPSPRDRQKSRMPSSA